MQPRRGPQQRHDHGLDSQGRDVLLQVCHAFLVPLAPNEDHSCSGVSRRRAGCCTGRSGTDRRCRSSASDRFAYPLTEADMCLVDRHDLALHSRIAGDDAKGVVVIRFVIHSALLELEGKIVPPLKGGHLGGGPIPGMRHLQLDLLLRRRRLIGPQREAQRAGTQLEQLVFRWFQVGPRMGLHVEDCDIGIAVAIDLVDRDLILLPTPLLDALWIHGGRKVQLIWVEGMEGSRWQVRLRWCCGLSGFYARDETAHFLLGGHGLKYVVLAKLDAADARHSKALVVENPAKKLLHGGCGLRVHLAAGWRIAAPVLKQLDRGILVGKIC
mmetsp:Transcript_20931/g.33388  ORF Transcript_20931/g.33388 Transcript_20931/m.33388 type:complete len:326 (+) Transcript_20931:257-1234(+)